MKSSLINCWSIDAGGALRSGSELSVANCSFSGCRAGRGGKDISDIRRSVGVHRHSPIVVLQSKVINWRVTAHRWCSVSGRDFGQNKSVH